jgi:phosphohistidine phosphatase
MRLFPKNISMKTIILIRHARSDWSDTSLPDFERWLCKRGKKEIKEMGKILKEISFETDIFLCSLAKRAKLTLDWLKGKYSKIKKIPTTFLQEIYDFHLDGSKKIIEIIKATNPDLSSITLIGHNPAFDEILENLTSVRGLHISTLAFVEIEFEVKKWSEINKNGKLKTFISPKLLE